MTSKLWRIASGMLIVASFLTVQPATGRALERDDGAQPTAPPVDAAWHDGIYSGFALDLGTFHDLSTDADFEIDSFLASAGHLALGRRVGPLRLEAELFMASHQFDDLNLGPTSPFPPGEYTGAVRTTGGMVNLYLELPLSGRVRPYAGAGAGGALAVVDIDRTVCDYYCEAPDEDLYDGWGVAGAWQAMAGISILDKRSGGEIVLGYRYFGTTGIGFASPDGANFEQEGIESHSITIGYRYRFGLDRDN